MITAGMGTLNIKDIKTVEQLNAVNWETYTDLYHPNWIRYIHYPVSCDALDDICVLSGDKNSNVKLIWSMGELHLCSI
jgi:hypothetical protein